MTRTRTVVPQIAGKLLETPVTVPTRPDTPETRAEDEASERQLAEELAQDDPADPADPSADSDESGDESAPRELTEEELSERQHRNQKFWRDCVFSMLPRHSDEASICEMADTLTREFDRRFEGGWFAHQHELQ